MTLAGHVLTADTALTWSLLGESNSDYGLTKAACSPLPLSRHELGKPYSDASQGFKGLQDAGYPIPNQEPPPGSEPGTFRLQGGCAADCAKEAYGAHGRT